MYYWLTFLKLIKNICKWINLFDYSFSFFTGFYLFLQVHFTSLHQQNVKLRHYLCIGWGKSNFSFSLDRFFPASRALLWKGSQPLTYKGPISTLRTKDSIIVETLLIWVCLKVEIWIGFSNKDIAYHNLPKWN